MSDWLCCTCCQSTEPGAHRPRASTGMEAERVLLEVRYTIPQEPEAVTIKVTAVDGKRKKGLEKAKSEGIPGQFLSPDRCKSVEEHG